MPQYIIAQGIKGVLAGDPGHPERFLCQVKKTWEPGKMPAAMHKRYEPCIAVYTTKRAAEAVRKGAIRQLAKLEADSPDAAMEHFESTPAAKTVADTEASAASAAETAAAAQAKVAATAAVAAKLATEVAEKAADEAKVVAEFAAKAEASAEAEAKAAAGARAASRKPKKSKPSKETE